MARNRNIALVEAQDTIAGYKRDFELRAVDRAMRFETEAGFAMQILGASEYTLGVALNNKGALAAAITNVAAIGLSLNPASKLAYLVPRKPKSGEPTQVCLDISWMGLVELAVRGGSILFGKSILVHAKDAFEMLGVDKEPIHRYDPFSRDRGPVVGAYNVAKLPSGDFITEVMSVDEINAIRDRSEAWKSGKSCPWRTDWNEMARKTVTKRASKYWRGYGNTELLDKAINYLNTEGGEGLVDIVGAQSQPGTSRAAASNGPVKFDVEHFIARIEAAKSDAECVEIYREGVALITKTRDMAGGTKFKQAVIARRNWLANNTIDMPTTKKAA